MAIEKKKVSVIIVVKNGERFLAKAIESVLNQTEAASEIIVIDGNSTDKTMEIAKSYAGVTCCLVQKKNGLANARNLGIQHAENELIAFLDHDDYWPENKLSIQVQEFLKTPELQYSYGQVRLFLEDGSDLRNGFEKYHFNSELIGRTPGTLMARKSLFDEIGGFNPKYSIACDVDWFTRASDYNIRHIFLPQILLYKRIHHSNLSGNVETNKKELFRVIKASLGRQ